MDLAHARHVAKASALLFDETQSMHQLSPRARDLLDAAALLHNIALAQGEDDHHLAGRDIVIAAPLAGFSHAERAVLACIVAFHEGLVRPGNEPLYKAIPPDQQREVLILSAIVRVADGLDHSQTQTTSIARVKQQEPSSLALRFTLYVTGLHSHTDAAYADRKADLWRKALGELAIVARVETPHLSLDDTLAEAGRKVLRYRFDWSGGEAAWQFDAQPEVAPQRVSRLRVAARRMRNDLRLFEDGFRGKVIRPVEKGLHAWSSALREARMCDALLASVIAYDARCDDEARAGLAPLFDDLRRRRADASAKLLALAARDESQVWLEAFEALLSAEDACAFTHKARPGEPAHLRHVADLALWQAMSNVRAFDTLPAAPHPKDLHVLRLAIKRLRYTVEALRDVLPTELTQTLLRQCIAAQDAYGEINDAYNAATHARAYATGVHRRQRQRIALKGILTYAEAQDKVIETRLMDWRDYLQPFL
jgi:CHAD domain-containing protein